MIRASGGAGIAVGLGVLAMLASVKAAAPQSPEAEGWRAIAELRFGDATAAFRLARRDAPDSRPLQLGEATALLNESPKTDSKLARATALLEGIAAGPIDDSGVAARYLLARIADTHATKPRYAEAAERYRELLRVAPQHPFAQRAAVKLALLLLYVPGVARDSQGAFTEAESLVAVVSQPDAHHDLRLALARGYLHFEREPRRALAHLIAAEKFGFGRADQRMDGAVTLHRLADELGDTATAIRAGQAFVAANPHDSRSAIIRTRLAELRAAEAQ